MRSESELLDQIEDTVDNLAQLMQKQASLCASMRSALASAPKYSSVGSADSGADTSALETTGLTQSVTRALVTAFREEWGRQGCNVAGVSMATDILRRALCSLASSVCASGGAETQKHISARPQVNSPGECSEVVTSAASSSPTKTPTCIDWNARLATAGELASGLLVKCGHILTTSERHDLERLTLLLRQWLGQLQA